MRDIDFRTFSIQNFLSIGTEPVEIVFTPGLHIITGINKDRDGRRNGVGKSTIVDAIHWVLFGDPMRPIVKATIANFNTKGSCTGTIEFDVTLNGKKASYKIVRILSPSKLHLFIDGEDKTLSTIGKTGELIENILGFTSTLFKNSVILSINNTQSFFAQDKTNKRKFIEGIFNLEVFSNILGEVRTRSVEIKKQIDVETAKVDAKKQNIAVYVGQRDLFEVEKTKRQRELLEHVVKYREQLAATKLKLVDTDPVTSKQSELRAKRCTILDVIKGNNVIIDELNKAVWKSNSEIEAILKEEKQYQTDVRTTGETLARTAERERDDYIKEFNRKRDDQTKDFERQKDEYLRSVKAEGVLKLPFVATEKENYIKSTQATVCPTCKKPLKEKIELDPVKIAEFDKRIEELCNIKPDPVRVKMFDDEIVKNNSIKINSNPVTTSVLEEYEKKITAFRGTKPDQDILTGFTDKIASKQMLIAELNVKIQQNKDVNTKYETEGISKIDEGLERLQQVIVKNDQVKVEVEFSNRQLAQAEKQLMDSEQSKNTFIDLLATAQKELETLETTSKDLQKLFAIYESAKYIVSEEGVKAFIIKKLLSVLNDRIDYYLRKLDGNGTCVFDEFFAETIKNDKGVECSYFNFSGAEMKAIDLACLFAFMDIRRLQGDVAINMSMYDELFDSSFDEKGLDHIVEILKERVTNNKEAVFVISHRKESLKAATGEIITLEKQNGITRRLKNA